MVRTNKARLLLLSNRVGVIVKEIKFIKKQEASRLLNNLGLKTFSSKIPLLGVLKVYNE